MDGESDAGSLENGSNMEDEQNSQTVVTDEFFAELTSKANTVTTSLILFYSHASFPLLSFFFFICAHCCSACLVVLILYIHGIELRVYLGDKKSSSRSADYCRRRISKGVQCVSKFAKNFTRRTGSDSTVEEGNRYAQ